jgi:hypothetical protein
MCCNRSATETPNGFGCAWRFESFTVTFSESPCESWQFSTPPRQLLTFEFHPEIGSRS